MLYSTRQCYCMHSFFLQVSCFLCQFVAQSISFQLVSPCSPGSFSLFQLVPGSSNSFRLVSSFSMYPTRHVRRLFAIFWGWNHAITWLSFHACIYELKSYWMSTKFLNENNFLNEYNIFEWTWNFWMKLMKLIKQHKTEGKSKL